MGTKLPKQFLNVKDRPILMYTIEQFYFFDSKAQIILTLPTEWKDYWEALIQKNDFKIPHRVSEIKEGCNSGDSCK